MNSATMWRSLLGAIAAMFVVAGVVGCGGREEAGATPTEEVGADPAQTAYYIECLDSPTAMTRAMGLTMLEKLGPQATEALPKLEEMRESSTGELRVKVEKTIKAIEGG